MNRVDKMCGFTLIEIILSITVVAIALTGLTGAISYVTKQNVQNEIQTTATELAQERIEQLIAEKSKNGLNSTPALDVTPSPSYVPVSGFSGYEQQTEICYADIPSSDPTQCWAVGGETGVDTAPVSVILKYDGSTWASVSSPTANGLREVYCVSTTDCWAVGELGVILHYNGSAWSTVSSPAVTELHEIKCVNSNDCFATGHANGSVENIAHWNGTSWSAQTSPRSNNDIEALVCTASNNCWAGENPAILLYNGSVWSTYSQPSPSQAYDGGAYCNNASDCWMAGWQGDIKHWNGTTDLWASKATVGNLEMVTCTGSSDCWAVGGATGGPGKAYRYNGSTWTVLSPDPSPNQLKYIDCEATDNCRAVGRLGTILRWNGTTWSAETSNTTKLLWGVYCWVDSSGATVTKTSPCNSGGTAGYKYITVTVRQNGLSSPITSAVTTLMSDY